MNTDAYITDLQMQSGVFDPPHDDEPEEEDDELPVVANDGLQKCCFVGCENRGVPQDGFDFFGCEPCLDELERRLNEAAERQQQRHANN